MSSHAPWAADPHASRGRLHPVEGCFSVDAMAGLEDFIRTSQKRRVVDWVASIGAVTVDFPDAAEGYDPFFNINMPEDLISAENIAAISG